VVAIAVQWKQALGCAAITAASFSDPEVMPAHGGRTDGF